MLITVLFIIAKNGNSSKVHQLNDGKQNVLRPYIGLLFSIKRNEVQVHAIKCMTHENFLLVKEARYKISHTV